MTELFFGKGMSDMYMLNNVVDKTPSWRSPALKIVCLDVWLLYVVYCLWPFK